MNNFELRLLKVGPVGFLEGLLELLSAHLNLLWSLDFRLDVEMALNEFFVEF